MIEFQLNADRMFQLLMHALGNHLDETLTVWKTCHTAKKHDVYRGREAMLRKSFRLKMQV